MKRSSRLPLARKARTITFIAGLVFLGIGSTLLFNVLHNGLFVSWYTRERVAAPAFLQSVELRYSSGGRGGGITQWVKARYTYSFHGEAFSGDRVTLLKSSDDLFQLLSTAWRQGTPISVFIDPHVPQYSVINRDFAWWPLVTDVPFSFVFAGVGVFLLWAAIHAPTPHPTEPFPDEKPLSKSVHRRPVERSGHDRQADRR